eukprot:TRINITY_DN4806_c0_g1_i9.p1 TRINITY_DN4806_c0_g1~~TRINITY_DN4806_c0_g1_i9.p1  ORF type:complete len:786 (-),score=87.76 TRINITY_DN4806_c0_g1_i9:315-2672(-)
MIRLNKSCPVVLSNASEITVTEQSEQDHQGVAEFELQSAHLEEQDLGEIPSIPQPQKQSLNQQAQFFSDENVEQQEKGTHPVEGSESQPNYVQNIISTLSSSPYYTNSREFMKSVVEYKRQTKRHKLTNQKPIRGRVRNFAMDRARIHDDNSLAPSCIITANKNLLDDPQTKQTLSEQQDDGGLVASGSHLGERIEARPGLLNLIEHFRDNPEHQIGDLSLNNQNASASLLQQEPSLSLAPFSFQTADLYQPNQFSNSVYLGGGGRASEPILAFDALRNLVSDPDTLHRLGNLRSTITDGQSTFPVVNNMPDLFEPHPLCQDHRKLTKKPRTQKRRRTNYRERTSSGTSPSTSLDSQHMSPGNSHGNVEEERKYKGVIKQNSKWRARVCHQGKTVTVGLCNTPEEAARTYDEALIMIKGPKIARDKTNFPLQQYQHTIQKWENQQLEQYKKLMSESKLPALKTTKQDFLSEARTTKSVVDVGDYKPFSTVPPNGFRPVVTWPPKPHNQELRFANLMLHPEVVKIQRQVLDEWKSQDRPVIEVENVIQGASENFNKDLIPTMIDQLQDLLQINSREEMLSCQLPQRYLNIRDDLVELFKVEEDDKRVELRGKLGVRARVDLRPGTVLGVLRGFMFKKEAYLSTIMQAEQHGVVSIELLDYKSTQYGHDVEVVGDSRLCFMLTQYCYGNLLAEVNDPHVDVFNLNEGEYVQDNWGDQQPQLVAAPNADVLHFQIAGFPVPVMVVTKSISTSEELLYCYGWPYWGQMKTMQSRYKNMINESEFKDQNS